MQTKKMRTGARNFSYSSYAPRIKTLIRGKIFVALLLVTQVVSCTYYPQSPQRISGILSNENIIELMTKTEGPDGLLTWDTYWIELVRHGDEPAVRDALREAANETPLLHANLYSNTALFQLRDQPEQRLIKILQALESSRTSEETNWARSAISFRTGVDDEYVPYLLLMQLSTDDPSTKQFLAGVIRNFPEFQKTVDSLIGFTSFEDPWVRGHSATAIGQFALNDPSILLKENILIRMTALLDDDQSDVQARTSATLLQFCSGREWLSPYKEVLLNPGMSYARVEAVGILISTNSHSDSIPVLTELLNDPDTSVQLRAIEELGLIGAASENALPLLRTLLESGDPRIRQAAEESITEINSAMGTS